MLECGLCKDCQWWNAPFPDQKNCWGDCAKADHEDALFGSGDSYVGVSTDEDFGCVQFTARKG